MSQTRRSWLAKNAALLTFSLALGLAIHGCGSDDEELDAPDGGDSAGAGGGGNGGSGGSGANGQAGNLGSGGGTADGGTDGPQGAGGSLGAGGSGGTSMQMGGQGGRSMNNPDGGSMLQCVAGGMCSGNDSCMRTCQNSGTVTCVCVGNRLFCGNCERNPDAGMQMNPNACPQNPQGAACDAEAQAFCQYGTNAENRGQCICSGGKYFCPGLPPPAGTAACPANPGFKPCATEGSFCSQDQNRACQCTRVSQGMNGLIWICR